MRTSLQKKHKPEESSKSSSSEPSLSIADLKDTLGNSLTEEQPPPRPCILEALGSAASGAFIGALYGFGEGCSACPISSGLKAA